MPVAPLVSSLLALRTPAAEVAYIFEERRPIKLTKDPLGCIIAPKVSCCLAAEQTLKLTADALVVTTQAQAVRREEDEISQALRQQESGICVNPLKEAELYTRGGQEPDQRVSDATNWDSTETSEAPRSRPEYMEEGGLESEPRIGGATNRESMEAGEGLSVEFADDIFVTGREKRQFSRQEKRAARQHFSSGLRGRGNSEQIAQHAPDIPAKELQQLQETDKTLEMVRKLADGEPGAARSGFFWQEGWLYRKW